MVIPILIPFAIALVALGILYSLTRRVRGRLIMLRPRHNREIRIVSNLILGTATFIILMAFLEAVNVPLGNVWTAISTLLALVAIGFFAVWSILSHMTAAVVLFLQRPFRIGDYLQFGDETYSGKVVRTGLFFTQVEDSGGGRSQIPNNLLFQRRFRVTEEKPDES
ncbi:MAG TPA: mechanosensitive ion channel family protein [Oceanipulchritudo sp.]|nr:mechanosensitive ion channel family protein [Oceanipulchritudo sp.]